MSSCTPARTPSSKIARIPGWNLSEIPSSRLSSRCRCCPAAAACAVSRQRDCTFPSSALSPLHATASPPLHAFVNSRLASARLPACFCKRPRLVHARISSRFHGAAVSRGAWMGIAAFGVDEMSDADAASPSPSPVMPTSVTVHPSAQWNLATQAEPSSPPPST